MSRKTDWKPGDRLRHRFNPDLGPGTVVSVEGRSVVVEFPDATTILRLAVTGGALLPLEFAPGTRARLLRTGEAVLVAGVDDAGRVTLDDGRQTDLADLWPIDVADSPVDLLAQGEVGSVEAFALRLDALHLTAVREADGLGSFLGGRIRLFPHQLHVAERATRSDPVRWLLADEVGLGKTVEACLILNHLVRARRAERVLVVAPRTLAVQWLGELWRKYHQVFAILDDKRLADVERDFGAGFNPFDVHRRVVVALETLVDRPKITQAAVAAGIDLLIVDEAHHLRRPPGHPGDPAYRAVAPIAALGRHVLLLSATPLEEDAHGFFRLLQLLRPEEFPEGESFEARLARREPLPACASSTRRADIGGLPPRKAVIVPIAAGAEGWDDLLALERATRALPAEHAVARREKAEKIRRALASGASLLAVLGVPGGPDEKLRALARRALVSDPRIQWLVSNARKWKDRGDKTLVFVAERETQEALQSALSRVAQLRAGVFHEDLAPGQGDIEVAQFRLPSGPSILISTECGGEGRNFEFCRRLVLFDLPWNPAVVEQRIGRLDRIGRKGPVEIVSFHPPEGLAAEIASLYERLGIFREPLGGLERELASVEAAIVTAALGGEDAPRGESLGAAVANVDVARDRARQAADHELYREPYRAELAEPILDRVPPDLDDLTQDVVLAAAEQFALHVEVHRDGARHSIELGARARVDSLPGVPGGSSFLGSFDREEAVADESIDFYALGHPLVEGVIAELDDGPVGRTCLLHVDGGGEVGLGLLAFFREGRRFDAVAVDAKGRARPEWAEALSRRPLRTRRIAAPQLTKKAGWAEAIRSMYAMMRREGRPIAVAALVVGSPVKGAPE